MIDALEQLNEIGWVFTILAVILVAVVIIGLVKLWKDLKSSLGLKSTADLEKEQAKKDIEELKTKHENLKNEFHTYCDKHEQDCITWRGQSVDYRDNFMDLVSEITKTLNDIKLNALDEKIERMRWKILDFASQLRNGRISYPEQFNNVLKTYDDYEKILEDNHLTNGQVDESIKFIREKYHEMLVNGK